ncbi:MAG: SPASM domain-containing protein [Planctomycetota bacterium]
MNQTPSICTVIEADLEVTPIGTRSRLTEPLLGIPVLRRTVERVARAKNAGPTFVLCPLNHVERCSSILKGTQAIIRPHDGGPPPWRTLVQTARKWSLDGWRGGIGGTTAFDEFVDVRLLAGLLEHVSADMVLSLPAAAPVLDPALCDRLVEHLRADDSDTRLAFSQAPPGLTGVLLHARLIKELAEKCSPLGWVFAYKPDDPRKDLIFETACCSTPVEIRQSSGRLLADTDHSMNTLTDLLTDHSDPDGSTIGHWLMRRAESHIPQLPREVEIELTTDDPHPESLLRPRGSRVPQRGPIDPAILQQITSELMETDDSLVVLGGFGDPLCHPQLREVLHILRPTPSNSPGVYGLAVRTSATLSSINGRMSSGDLMELLMIHRVDVFGVLLDAWSAPLYARVQSPNAHEHAELHAVLLFLDELSEARQARNSVTPLILPEFTKIRENVHEMDNFFDGWIRKLGAAAITGYSHRAGQMPDRSVINMAPAARGPCRRIQSRCLVLADGTVTMCDQDYQGRFSVGKLTGRGSSGESLQDIWQGALFQRIRDGHQREPFAPNELCAACDEWHRP